jgi:two-component system LytT family sensor kinase
MRPKSSVNEQQDMVNKQHPLFSSSKSWSNKLHRVIIIDYSLYHEQYLSIFTVQTEMKKTTEINLIAFYLVVAVIYLFLWLSYDMHSFNITFLQAVLNNAWRVIFIVVVNYIFFEYALPNVFRKRRFIVYNIFLAVVLFFAFFMIWSFGLYAWRSIGVALHIYEGLGPQDNKEVLVQSQMEFSAGSIFFFGIIRHIYKYVKLNQAAQQLRIEKQEAELSYLKSQTNPHFLFNTLNNIYSLARDKSDLAPQSILRLSKILRFMLYETGGNFIPVEQEVKVISDYIDLEKLRYDESLQVRFTTNIEDIKQGLPPLLLIPLVENAFKHGISETRGNPFVEVHLSVLNRKLTFIVKNSTGEQSAEQPIKENIGLSNLRRQLELLYKDYSLHLQQGSFEFTATLKINLASHV